MREPEGIRPLLEIDRVWSLYALGDLAPDMLPLCEWPRSASDPRSFALIYRGAKVPVVQAFGEGPALEELLARLFGESRRVFFVVRPEMLDAVRRAYPQVDPHPMSRMTLPVDAALPPRSPDVVRLGPADLEAVRALHADGADSGELPPFFAPDMLERGVYCGVWEGPELIASAGTHIVSKAESLAAIGNVYTRRDHRGRGLAARTTAEVTRELRTLGLRTVGLNVNRHNPAAARVYRKLGFEARLEYFEGPAWRD